MIGALEALVEPGTRGDPCSPLRWTCKSTRTLARELTRQGSPVSSTKIGQLLRAQGYSLQANRKTTEGKQHPDRDTQFEHISKRVAEHQQPLMLYGEIGKLKMELDWLKKKSGINLP